MVAAVVIHPSLTLPPLWLLTSVPPSYQMCKLHTAVVVVAVVVVAAVVSTLPGERATPPHSSHDTTPTTTILLVRSLCLLVVVVGELPPSSISAQNGHKRTVPS